MKPDKPKEYQETSRFPRPGVLSQVTREFWEVKEKHSKKVVDQIANKLAKDLMRWAEKGYGGLVVEADSFDLASAQHVLTPNTPAEKLMARVPKDCKWSPLMKDLFKELGKAGYELSGPEAYASVTITHTRNLPTTKWSFTLQPQC